VAVDMAEAVDMAAAVDMAVAAATAVNTSPTLRAELFATVLGMRSCGWQRCNAA
jgi:hypothetical protein